MTILFTLVARGLLAAIDAAPTLLVGVMIAAWLRVVVGPAKLRQIFSGEGTAGLWRASLLATLAPVCSLGVLPISRELHRAGISTAKVMAFTLAAPLLNPLTLVYGITTFELPIFLFIVAVSLTFSFGVGAITGRWLEEDEDEESDAEVNDTVFRAVGLRRMANLAITTSRLCAGVVVIDFLICVLVSALTAACIPNGWLVSQLKYTNPTAPLTMSAVAWTSYVSPTTGVMQVSTMSKIQLSLGAAIVLHLLGVGLNASGLRWILSLHGMRRLISLALVILAMTWAMGYAADAVLGHPPGAENDTHALDSFTRAEASVKGITWESVSHSLALFNPSMANWVAAVFFGVGIVAGLIFRATKIEMLADPTPKDSQDGELMVSGKDIVLPRSVVIAVALCGLVVIGVLGLYIYYPPVSELLDEMSARRADVIISIKGHDAEVAPRSIRALEDAARKLPVSAALRLQTVPEDAGSAVKTLCDQLTAARDAIQRGELKDVNGTANEINESYQKVRTFFQPLYKTNP